MASVFGIVLMLGLFVGIPFLIKRAVDKRPFDPSKYEHPGPHNGVTPGGSDSPSATTPEIITVRGIGYRDVVRKVAQVRAEQARRGRQMVRSQRSLLYVGGMGSPMGWKLHFQDAGGTALDAPIGPIEVEVVRFSLGGKRGVDRRNEIEAAGGICWFSVSVFDRGYPYEVIGYETVPMALRTAEQTSDRSTTDIFETL